MKTHLLALICFVTLVGCASTGSNVALNDECNPSSSKKFFRGLGMALSGAGAGMSHQSNLAVQAEEARKQRCHDIEMAKVNPDYQPPQQHNVQPSQSESKSSGPVTYTDYGHTIVGSDGTVYWRDQMGIRGSNGTSCQKIGNMVSCR